MDSLVYKEVRVVRMPSEESSSTATLLNQLHSLALQLSLYIFNHSSLSSAFSYTSSNVLSNKALNGTLATYLVTVNAPALSACLVKSMMGMDLVTLIYYSAEESSKTDTPGCHLR
jgi:hypothetical protein